MSNYISLIAISGVLGTINYWIFSSMELLDFFDHNEADEKNSLIIALGLINFVTNDLLRFITDYEWHWSLYLVVSFIGAFIVEIFMFKMLKKLNDFTKEKYYDDKKSCRIYVPILKKLIEDDIGEEVKVYVYIYDFNNDIIEHGRLKYYTPSKKEESSLVIQLDPDSGLVETDFEKLRETFPIDETMNVYVNFEKQYKIYFIIEEKKDS